MEEMVAIAGRRESVHRVHVDRHGRTVFGEERCNLESTDEEWRPRAVHFSQVPVDAHRCGWCFPRHEGD